MGRKKNGETTNNFSSGAELRRGVKKMMFGSDATDPCEARDQGRCHGRTSV